MVRSDDVNQSEPNSITQGIERLTSLTHAENQALRVLFQKLLNEYSERQDILNQGVELVTVLDPLSMDLQALQVGLLYPLFAHKVITFEKIELWTENDTARLLTSVLHLQNLNQVQGFHVIQASEANIDRLRRMLLEIAEDIRVIIIKLAERICILRHAKHLAKSEQTALAQETLTVFAPLANRLGIGQLKWELEDLAFRYLHADTYKNIARLLDQKRAHREQYIDQFVSTLKDALTEHQINAKVYGRPKHIYSIWLKMQKKDMQFSDLYDVLAIRIVTEETQDCYAVLSTVHNLWHQITSEFDDYIAHPKANGYRSIHTVVEGPENRSVEIQIRTQQMHEDAELGVAAHWKYKEDTQKSRAYGFEEKITWLRKLLAWQEEITENKALAEELHNQVFEERVYVFTPKGDIFDLPKGATPLDFAYYVHSDVGHRCIGAKISGRIVSFQYALQTGDQIEILTQKHPNPSRDWMNPHSGYIQTPRARSKVAAWFKKQDRSVRIQQGRVRLEKELERYGLTLKHVDAETFKRFNLQGADDFFAQLGSGDLRINQVTNYLNLRFNQHKNEETTLDKTLSAPLKKSNSNLGKTDITVQGVGNLMTTLAGCCDPIFGDPIVGYVTQNRGVTIHRKECPQFQLLAQNYPERVVTTSWGEKTDCQYQLTLCIRAINRLGLLKDISTLITHEQAKIIHVQSTVDENNKAVFEIVTEIKTLEDFNRLMKKIKNLSDVTKAYRV